MSFQVDQWFKIHPTHHKQLVEYYQRFLTPDQRVHVEKKALRSIKNDNWKVNHPGWTMLMLRQRKEKDLEDQTSQPQYCFPNYTNDQMQEIYFLMALKDFCDFPSNISVPLEGLYAINIEDNSRLYFQKEIISANETEGLRQYLAYYLSAQEVEENLKFKSSEPSRWRIVRWLDPSLNLSSIEEEMQIWLKIKEMDFSQPNISSQYLFYGQRVLVMDYFEPLRVNEWPLIILHLLEELYFLHRYAVYNGLRPQNVSWFPGQQRYFLNNFNSLTYKVKAYGFERHTWYPGWASQVEEIGQVTTAKYDLIELAYLLNALIYQEEKGQSLSNNDIRMVTSPLAQKFLAYVQEIDEKSVTDQVYYNLSSLIREFESQRSKDKSIPDY